MKYYAVKTSYGFQVIEEGTAGRHVSLGEHKVISETKASYLINQLESLFEPFEVQEINK